MARVVRSCRRLFSSAPAEKLEHTALYNLHLELGGKMVPFAGYSLPVQYPDGVLSSHLRTRMSGCAALFDVGHMGQLKWHGKDRARFLEKLIVADVAEVKEGDAKLTLVTNEKGGIIDDSVFTNHGSYIYMVVNGATKHGDMAHFNEQLAAFKAAGGDASYEYLHTQNLLALQGPGSAAALAKLVDGGSAAQERVARMPFMTGGPARILGVDGCIITRCGYTGEDGYEVSVPHEAAVKVATALLDSKAAAVLPAGEAGGKGRRGGAGAGPGTAAAQPLAPPAAAGLGARDSLRLEAGLCLYGHDLNETITPVEAALLWTVGKRRRAEGGFLGAAAVLAQVKDKGLVARKRVGLAVQGAPAREGARIFAGGAQPDASAKPVGVVTSGTFSPCLKAPIAMGYVPPALSEAGTALWVEVRGKLQPAAVAKMPFVPHAYYKPAA